LCIRALGSGCQDEVITTAFSFVASTNCILFEGALPAFIDIDPVTLNMDANRLRHFLQHCCTFDPRRNTLIDQKTGRRIKAILPVHAFGVPCEMDPILELAREYSLDVIEDSCEALGAEYRGRRAGTFGDAAAFAFYPNKQITTGEGGMIVTDDEELARLCRSMRNQGRGEDSSWLQHERLGYNYRLSELHCALGLAQLGRVNELLEARERVAAVYSNTLAGIPNLILPSEFADIKRSWFVYPVQLDWPAPRALRDRLLFRLRQHGVECQAYFPAIHKHPHIAAFSWSPLGRLRCTEEAADRCFALPFFSSASAGEIEYASTTLGRILQEEIGHPAFPRSTFAAASD
jgi:perosamine synthetase